MLRAARLLEEAGADYNILTVVTEQLARHIRQVYAFYKKQGWRYQQYIPCLDPLEAPREACRIPSRRRVTALF